MPTDFHFSPDFLRNFKLRAAIHHAKHQDGFQCTHIQATNMLSQYKLKNDERDSIKDPMAQHNFGKLYNEIMNSDGSTWKVLSYLQRCKRELPGFDYEIHYAEDGHPDGIMYMTAQMKNNLIRYGHIMYLDSQKRAFNKLGWPYIGISLHNNNLRVCVCCEAIVNGETIVMYTWII